MLITDPDTDSPGGWTQKPASTAKLVFNCGTSDDASDIPGDMGPANLREQLLNSCPIKGYVFFSM